MYKYISISAILLLGASVPSSAQTDLSGIVTATRKAQQQQQDALVTQIGNIAADMRKEQAATAGTLAGVASAMRAATSQGRYNQATSAADNNFYNSGDINYSTYGADARGDIARNATTYNNPYIMGDYSAGGIYAVPAGKKYFNSGGSGAQSPVSGRLTSGFGYRPSFGRMHNGVDISLNTGDTVRAAFSGKVVLVANNAGGYGRYVKLQHNNGLETLYGHLSAPLVVHGQKIEAGQPLGLGGATGNATGPHLHFETRLNGVAVDPSNYFEFSESGKTVAKKGGAAPIRDNNRKTTANKNIVDKTATRQSAAVAPKSNLKTETVASATGGNKGKQPRPATYKVRHGDTVAKIARNYGISVGELCRINKMSPYTPMYSGKVIRLK